LAIEPELTVSSFRSRIPFPMASMAATYVESLRTAGVPE
jgi:hypothetical protein